MPPTERRTRFGVEVGLANPGGLAGEIRREVSEGQRQANAAAGTARAARAAGSAEDRRLRTLELQNQALREQARLYRRAMGVSLDRRSSPGVVEARSRVLGREVRSSALDAASRALFVEQQRLAAVLQARREQYRREASQLAAGQRGVSGFFTGIAAQNQRSQRSIGRGFGDLFGAAAGYSDYQREIAAELAELDAKLRANVAARVAKLGNGISAGLGGLGSDLGDYDRDIRAELAELDAKLKTAVAARMEAVGNGISTGLGGLGGDLGDYRREIVLEMAEIDAKLKAAVESRIAAYGRGISTALPALGGDLASYRRELLGEFAEEAAARRQQTARGIYNLGQLPAQTIGRPAVQVANRLGLPYDELEAAARRAGKSLDEFVRIKSGATAAEARNERQLKGLTTVTSGFDQTNRRNNSGLRETSRILRSLFVAFVGFQIFRGVQNSLRSLIDYQKQLQSVRLGVAEILLIGNRFRDRITGAILPIGQQIQQSFALATRASRELVEQSIRFGLPLDTLVGTFQTVGGLAASAGVSFKDTLDIITQIGVVAQRLNIPFNQLTRSADNIFTGLRVQQTQLGVILGLNQSIVQQQIRQGTLGQFLLDRLRGVGETLPENLNTLEGITQSIRSLGLDLLQRITGGGFEVIQEGLKGIRGELDQLRQSPNTLKEMRDSVTEYTKSLLDGARAVVRFVRENQTLINLLTGAFIGRRLVGGLAGAGLGAAAGAGVIDPSTALALGIPLAALGARRLAGTGRTLFGASASGLTGQAGILSRLSAAAPGAASVAGGLPYAIRGAVTGLLRFAGPLALATAALSAFTAAIRSAEQQAGRVDPITGRATRDDPYSRRFRPDTAVGRETAEEQRLRIRELGIAGLAELQSGVGTPASRDTLQRNLGLIEAAGFNNRSSFLKAGAEGQVKRLRELVGENSPILAFLNDLQAFGDTAELAKFSEQFDRLSGFVVGLEPTSLLDRFAKDLDTAIKGQRAIAEEQARELDVIRARNNLAEQQVAARQELRRVEARILEEQERALRTGLERSLSQQNLAFAQTTGQQRSGLQASITQIQARIGTTQQGLGLAESAGQYEVAEALQRQLDALQQALQRAQEGIADTEVAAARQALDQAGQKLSVEEKIASDVLPRRLALERELLSLQRQQAAIRAAGAAQELQFAQKIVAGAEGVQRLIAQRKDDLRARQDPNFNETVFAQQELEAAIEVNRARVQVVRSETDLAAARAQIAVSDKELQLDGLRAANERSEAERRINESRLDQVTAGQALQQSEADRNAVLEQQNQLLLEQHKRWQDIATVEQQSIGYMKDVVSQLIQGEDAMQSIEAFFKNINRIQADRISSALIDGLIGPNTSQRPPGGNNQTVQDIVERARGIFDGFKGGGGGTSGGFDLSKMLSGFAGGSGSGGGGFNIGSLFGGGGQGAAGGGGQFSGVVAGGSSTAPAAAGAGAGGAGALAGAGGYAAFIYAAIALGQASSAAAKAYKDIRYDLRASKEDVRTAPATAFSQSLLTAVLSAYGLGALSKPLGKLFSSAGTATLSNPNAKGILLNPLGSLIAATGQLVGLFQPKTAGSLIRQAYRPILRDIGLPQTARFGPDRGIPLSGALPANYASLFGEASTAGLIARSTGFSTTNRGDVLRAFPEVTRRILLGVSANLGLAPEDAGDVVRRFTQKVVGDQTTGTNQVLARYRRGRLTQDQASASITQILASFQDLSPAIDRASISLNLFTKDGQASLKALERTAQDANAVIVSGIPKALTDSIRTRSPIAAAESLAQSFADTFLNRLGESLVRSGGVQKALTEAVALSTRAADAFAAGDLILGNQLLGEARTAFLSGRNDFLRRTNTLYGPVAGFLNSLGIYGEGGLINPTGAGLPSFDTTSTRHVAGPTGAPSLSVLHGGEVIRAGAHDDAIATAVNNLAAAQAELAAALREGRSGGSDDGIALVQLGDDIIERATVRRVRRGAARGMRTPTIS